MIDDLRSVEASLSMMNSFGAAPLDSKMLFIIFQAVIMEGDSLFFNGWTKIALLS